MSAGSKAWGVCRNLAVRSRPAIPHHRQFSPTLPKTRPLSDIAKSPPTPVEYSKTSEAVPRTPEKVTQARADASIENASVEGVSVASEAPSDALGDEVLEQIFYGGRSAASETQDGLTSAQEEVLYRDGVIPLAAAAEDVLASPSTPVALSKKESTQLGGIGHNWPLPQRPFPDDYHHRRRYHPVLHQISRLLMRDGKLSAAQKNLAMVMNHLRTTPAPIYSPKFPLLPGTPPASHLPLNPVLYLTIAIDSVAPIVRVNRIAGGAGGGRALDMPIPIAVRARRRQAFQWIMDSVNNKPSRGSGPRQLPVRIAEEIIAVVEGRSGVWDKRKLVHKVCTAARGNVGKAVRVKKKA